MGYLINDKVTVLFYPDHKRESYSLNSCGVVDVHLDLCQELCGLSASVIIHADDFSHHGHLRTY